MSLQGSTIFPMRHILFLGLSLTAHLAVSLPFGFGGHIKEDKKISLSKILQIHVLQTKSILDLPRENLFHRREGTQTSHEQLAEKPWPLPILTSQKNVSKFNIERPDSYYFRRSELTEKPHVVVDIPADTIIALPELVQQSAVLRLLINEQGSIDKVLMVEAELSEQVRNSLLDNFKQIKFKPGKINGIAVKSELDIEVSFNSLPTISFSRGNQGASQEP